MEGIDPTQADIELQTARQIQRGAQRDLLLRIRVGFVARVAEVHTTRFDVQVFLEQVVSTAQAPVHRTADGWR